MQQEAELAVVKIAQSVFGGSPEKTKAVLEKVLQVSKNDTVRNQAQEILNQISRLEDYLTAWLVSGPWVKEGAGATDLFDVVFEPEKVGPKGVKWEVVPIGTDSNRPWLIELDKTLGGEDRVAYLKTKIWSDTEQKVRLELGSDDGVKVWLNGQIVHSNNTTRPCSPGQDKVDITLKEGRNSLMVKITQGGGGWAMCGRLRNLDDGKVEGIRTTIEQ